MEQHYLFSYFLILVVVLFALSISAMLLAINHTLGQKPREEAPIKGEVYECGVPPEGEGNQQFSVRYYVMGIIFLIFDVDVILMYPWGLVYKKMLSTHPLILLEMILFLLFFVVGLFYLKRRHAFDWD